MTGKLPCVADPGQDLATGRDAAPVRVSDRMSDAALDQLLSLHEALALPAGLAARILREVPLRPQLAGAGHELGDMALHAAVPGTMPGVARARGQVVPLRVVGGTDHGGRRPMATRLSAWRGALLMLGGTGIGALAASIAAVALFGSPFQSAPQGAPADAGAAAPALVASAAPTAPARAQSSATAAAPAAAAPGGRAQPAALAANAAPALPAPLASPPADTSDPDPVLPPAAPDRTKLAAQSPDPGPDQPGQMGPTLGPTRGAMGPFLPQGYGYSGGIGGVPGGMGPGSAIPGTMQSMPGHMPAGPSLP